MSECKHQDDTYYETLVESNFTDIEKPSDLNGWNEEEDVLECTRKSVQGDFCVFHQDLDIENREDVREKLVSELETSTNDPLLISEASMCRLIIEDITVDRPVWIIGSTFDNRFEIDNVDFEDAFILNESTFNDITEFKSINFCKPASFDDATFLSEAEFHLCEFMSNSKFTDVDFKNNALFDRLKFNDDCSFKYTTFTEEARFASCIFKGDADLYAVEFENETKIARARDIEQVDAQVNSKTRFDGKANLEEIKFKQNAEINIKFKDEINLQQANLSNCDLSDIELSGANLENANLADSILYNCDLRGCKLMGCNLNNARLNRNSKFLGNPQSDSVEGYEHSITTILETKRCYYDPNADFRKDNSRSDKQLRNKARTVYRELQGLAKSASHSQLQTRCFVRRKDMEKNRYWEDIWSTESGKSQPIVAAARWLRAKFSRVIMLYGESPWRVLFWSLFTIVGFALSYITFGLIEESNEVVQIGLGNMFTRPIEYFGTLIDSIYYSALIFTNLSFGRYSPVGVGTYATAIETTIGLTMLALFFFVLGRRASK